MFGTSNRNKITVSNSNTYRIMRIAIHIVSVPKYREIPGHSQPYFWPGPRGLWSKVVHYKGNRMPFGMRPFTQLQIETVMLDLISCNIKQISLLENIHLFWVVNCTPRSVYCVWSRSRPTTLLSSWCGYQIAISYDMLNQALWDVTDDCKVVGPKRDHCVGVCKPTVTL